MRQTTGNKTLLVRLPEKEKINMEIDLSKLAPRHSHDLLTSSIIPRPIAWISSINEEGQSNIAPFSFFTGISWAPPIIAFSVVNRSDFRLLVSPRKAYK